MKFLFTTLPSNDLGLLTRSLPIARGLKANGHTVLFSSPEKAPSLLLKDAGFGNYVPRHPLYQIKHIIKSTSHEIKIGNPLIFLLKLIRALPTKFAPATPEIWNMDHAAAIAGMMNENFVRANCEAYLRLIADLHVDIIVDFWNPFACIASRVLEKPLITVIQADGHPDNAGLIWWKDRPEDVPTALPTINKVMVDYGLKSLEKLEELNLGDLTLVIGTPEIDPIPEGSDFTHIGPILWEIENETLPEWIENLSRDRPLIWIYPGNPRYGPKKTILDSEIILRACIDVLSAFDVHVIVTMGNHSLPREFHPVPDNFIVAPYLPGLQLARRCDLMIHHGGYGSCQTGLYTGTPSVIIPTFSERESNARRIAATGAGEFVLPIAGEAGEKEIDLEEFRDKIVHVLSTPSYEFNAKIQSEKMTALGGPRKAVDLIEEFVNASWVRPDPVIKGENR